MRPRFLTPGWVKEEIYFIQGLGVSSSSGTAGVTAEGSRPVTKRSSRIRMLLDHSMAALPKNASGGTGEQPAGAGEGSPVMAFLIPTPPPPLQAVSGHCYKFGKGRTPKEGPPWQVGDNVSIHLSPPQQTLYPLPPSPNCSELAVSPPRTAAGLSDSTSLPQFPP